MTILAGSFGDAADGYATRNGLRSRLRRPDTAGSTVAANPSTDRVVCVDLDGTLIAGDLLWESLVQLFKRRPLRALRSLLDLCRGRAGFKRKLTESIDPDPATLPYRQDLLDHLRHLHRSGRRLVLATAADERYAHRVAGHLAIFADVVASDGRENLSGKRKAGALVERYGHGGFDYFGNDWSDVPVWEAAAEGIAIAPSRSLSRHLEAQQLVDRISDPRRGKLRAVARALRPHQWVKNFLVFVPLIAAHQVGRLDLWLASVLTFAAFSICASAIYILNDISDIPADRQHPRKRHRPFAAGDLSIPVGVVIAALLLIGAGLLAWFAISKLVALVLVAYVLLTSLYSLVLKRLPVADVFTLAGLYVWRLVAGGAATGIVLSSWLLAFALFFFLSLAFVKRYTEVRISAGQSSGRGYVEEDALWMHGIGTSSGYMAVLVLALYVNAPDVAALYGRPQILWLLCPMLLMWLTRLWFRAGRGLVHDDPVIEALKDRATYVWAVVVLLTLIAAV